MKVGIEIRKRNLNLIKVNEELRRLALTLINKKPDVKTPRDGVALYMMVKAYKTQGAILLLVHRGLTEDAEMLARTLFDTYTTIGLCMKDGNEEMATQFIDFDDVQRMNLYNKVVNNQNFSEVFKERITNPKPGDRNIDEVIKNGTEKIKKYGKGFEKHWYGDKSGTNLAGLLNIDRYYKTAFDLQSHLIHSLPRAINRYIRIVDGEITTNHNPSSENAGLALVSAFNMFVLVVGEYQKHFGYNVQTQLDIMVNKYKNAVDTHEGDL